MENVRKFVPEEQDQKIDIYTYGKIFWRKKFYLIIPVVLALVISVMGVRFLTPLYESSTLVSVQEQNILAGTMRRYITDVEQSAHARNQQFRTMIETRVMSRTFLEMIILDLGLQRSYDLRSGIQGSAVNEAGLTEDDLVMRRLVELLKDKIQVQMEVPGVFSISVLDSDPMTAYVLATKISDKFIEVTQLEKLQGLRQAGEFSDEQIAKYKEVLEESERELERIRRELAVTDVERNPVNAANVHVAETRAAALDATVGSIEIDLRRVRQRLSTVFDNNIPSTGKITDDETISNIERRLVADSEERILHELSGAAGTAANETAWEARRQAMWEEIRARIAEVVTVEYEQIDEDYRPLITEYFYQRHQAEFYRSLERRLTGFIEQYRTNLSRRPQLEREENKLVHEVETNRSVYEAFLESKTTTQITEAMQSTNLGVQISILEPAERPISPVKPNKLKIIILALVFGFACGFGSILVTEYMDDSFRNVEEVQRILGVPVLGTIPKTVAHFAWERRKRGRLILAWIIGLFLFISFVSGALYMYARVLEGTNIGVELTEDQIER
jgi:polysaccharide biosynthesis transport protein